MKQGLELLRLKQEESFRKKFAEAAALEPESPRSDFMMGLLYGLIANEQVKARQHFETCLKRDPENVAVLNNLALTAVKRGSPREAVDYWQKGLELNGVQAIAQNLGRFIDQAGLERIAASKVVVDAASALYVRMISDGKFESAKLDHGWLYMLLDDDTLSLELDGEEKAKPVAPPASADGAKVIGGGTGFVVAPGYIVTNQHVINEGTSFDIQVNEGNGTKLHSASLVAQQKKPDLAILKCDSLTAQPLAISSTMLRRGTDIMTLGYPEMMKLGASLKATRGVISSVPSSAVDDMYLFDAVINPGNSGGPVLDNRGNVVAVTTIMTLTAGKYGGGIPAHAVVEFVRKHVPNYATLPENTNVLDWPAVDQLASPATVLVWTRSKTASESNLASSDVAEDPGCVSCGRSRTIKCTGSGCVRGQVTIRRGASALKVKCPQCDLLGNMPCPICNGTGIDPAILARGKKKGDAESTAGNSTPVMPSTPPPLPPNRKYLTTDQVRFIANATKTNRTVDTEMHGTGKTQFRTIEGQSLVVGFQFAYGNFSGKQTIGTIRPVFMQESSIIRPPNFEGGERNPQDYESVYAKPGYAVAGLKIRAGLGVDSMSIVFMKINGNRLDPNDSYESPRYGGPGGSTKSMLGGDGSFVVRIFGKNPSNPQSTFNGLGLITIPQ